MHEVHRVVTPSSWGHALRLILVCIVSNFSLAVLSDVGRSGCGLQALQLHLEIGLSREARGDLILVTKIRFSLKTKIPVSEGFSPLAVSTAGAPVDVTWLAILGRESEKCLQSTSVLGLIKAGPSGRISLYNNVLNFFLGGPAFTGPSCNFLIVLLGPVSRPIEPRTISLEINGVLFHFTNIVFEPFPEGEDFR